jgi:hypothetical protein
VFPGAGTALEHDDRMNSANLTLHRDGPPALDSARPWLTSPRTRWLLSLAAGVVGLAGMRRRGFRSALLMLASTALYRAAAGHDDLARVGSLVQSLRGRQSARRGRVTTAGEESFPASDPPGWTPTVGGI